MILFSCLEVVLNQDLLLLKFCFFTVLLNCIYLLFNFNYSILLRKTLVLCLRIMLQIAMMDRMPSITWINYNFELFNVSLDPWPSVSILLASYTLRVRNCFLTLFKNWLYNKFLIDGVLQKEKFHPLLKSLDLCVKALHFFLCFVLLIAFAWTCSSWSPSCYNTLFYVL